MADNYLDLMKGAGVYPNVPPAEIPKPNPIKLSDYPNEKCPKCGCELFTTAVVIKDIPGIAMGLIGSETIAYPVEQYPILVCAKCGEIAPGMLRDEKYKMVIDKLLGNDNDKKEEK